MRFSPGLDANRNRHGKNAYGGGFPQSTHLQSRPPKPWPRSGQTGQPNQAPTMAVSRLTQNTMNADDIEYWMGDPDDPEDVGATFDPPVQFQAPYSDYMNNSNWMDETYLNDMDLLSELGFFKAKPAKTFKKLSDRNFRTKFRSRLMTAKKLADVHRRVVEKMRASGPASSPDGKERRIAQIRKNEDAALDQFMELNNELEKYLEFLNVYAEDLQQEPEYPVVKNFYEMAKTQIDNAITLIRSASKMGAENVSEVRKLIRKIVNELRDTPLMTNQGTFEPKGRTGSFEMYLSPNGVPVGVRKNSHDAGFEAFNFEDKNWAVGITPEEAVEAVTTAVELDEVSAVGGAAMGAPGQPSGQIRGHIGPLGSDNRSPYLGKDKKKKEKNKNAIRAFGGGSAQ